MESSTYGDIRHYRQGRIAVFELCRPPNNFFDALLIQSLADAYRDADADETVRAIVLCAAGKHFCAGADLAGRTEHAHDGRVDQGKHLYKYASRLVRVRKPVVAAIHGSAIGGGLGLALTADFRVTCEAARFSANFTRMSYHPGFGLTFTLPRLVGHQQAALLFYTGRRVSGSEAVALGMADRLVQAGEVRTAAIEMAESIAASGPLAVAATRETLRRGFAEAFDAATEREMMEQSWLRLTADYREGVSAMDQRREPDFTGR